ncbi:HNH endonuclease signature motif containing protein [Nocardia inohanensis]|uniref:HNH endonuclease signature motif containing protein n=1 Tax=Nocardia inohanensis TaxID=209246 RepID=UPI0008308F8D|nr:HNH endonuclease signature motif containing protein [Nocardia inohanensis]
MESRGENINETVALLTVAVESLVGADFVPCTDEQVVELLRGLETVTRKLAFVGHKLIVQAGERSLCEKAGLRTVGQFLEQTLHLSRAEAYARVRAATQVGQLCGPTGEIAAPVLPCTAEAQEAGEISSDHVRRIAAVMKRIPDHVDAVQRDEAEWQLADYARQGFPEGVSVLGARILGHLDPDGQLTDDIDRARRREFVVGGQCADGMTPIAGEITPELRALLDPVLAKFARPGVCNPDDPQSPTPTALSALEASGEAGRAVLDAAARRDTRTVGQRNHDALVALLSPGVTPDGLGRHRGLPVATIVTMSIDQLEKAAGGVATTATGGMVPIEDALRLAQRSKPYLAVFDAAGMPLHLARSERLATPAQRLALIASERGCTRPGCDAPASLSAVHHVTEWAKGGDTSINNLTLACDACHALVHDGPGGWRTVKLGKDSEFPGRTAWIAPEHLDPTGTPRVNHIHRPEDLLRETRARARNRARQQRTCSPRSARLLENR